MNNNLRMDKSIYMCEDLIFVLQYARYGESFSSLEKHLYNYNRLNQNSISSNISVNYFESFIKVWEKIEEIYQTVNQNKEKTNKLIGSKVQDMLLIFLVHQIQNIRELGPNTIAINIKEVLEEPFINAHKNNFSTENYFNKPLIWCIKKKSVRKIILYGILYKYSREIKKVITRRKKVII